MSEPLILTLKNKVANLETDVSNLKSKTLWTNSSPSSSFASKTLNPSGLSSYSKILIIAYRNYSDNQNKRTVTTYLEKGLNGELLYTDYFDGKVRSWSREIAFNTNGIYFGSSVINGELNNKTLVPYKIIGMK